MRAKKEMEFGLFRMKADMTLGEFYERFVEYRRILTAQKDEVPSQKREAQNFLQRLDERYTEMITSMDNGYITGKAYPASLAEAYEIARLWVIPSQKEAVTTSLALVATTKDSSRMKSGGGRGGCGAGGRSTGGRGGRGLPKKGSPPPKSLKKKVKFEESKSSGKVDMTGWVVSAGCEPDSKTCRGCLKKGHIWVNCPDRVTTEKVLVGQDEDD